MSDYTAITFAPVQGFIEKSRKLRDLYGASLILSYLSSRIVQEALCSGLEVISPGLPNLQEGMPNRILIKGKFDPNHLRNTLLNEWQKILITCRTWVEDNLGIPKDQYYWSRTEDQIGKHKGEWERWESHTWEIFWGYGDSVEKAMEDLETRKLKRDWIGINWMGESSSLTGTDAIAWHQLGKENKEPGRSLTPSEEKAQKHFYHRLAWVLDDPYARNYKVRDSIPSDEELEAYFKDETSGKFIAPGERLSIPELVKRLVTLPYLAKKIGMETLDEGFKDINREAGYWTGWFMGDGDKIGDKLQKLASSDNPKEPDRELQKFTELMRNWGQEFKGKKDLFPAGKGRVIYAGGDDFLGVLYSEEKKQGEKPEKIKPIEAFEWLLKLKTHWQKLQEDIKKELKLDFTFSVGFVWAGHQVPQRDVLQHCRKAEKLAKSLGRDRVTIRVVFNSGQSVEWTCPWDYLDILTKYRDRDGKTWRENPNWGHIYSDWAELKARHAIRLTKIAKNKYGEKESDDDIPIEIAVSLFNLYFDNAGEIFNKQQKRSDLIGDNTNLALVNWLDNLIEVGWQLCRNSNI